MNKLYFYISLIALYNSVIYGFDQFTTLISSRYLHYDTGHFWDNDGHKHRSHNHLNQNAVWLRWEQAITCNDTLWMEGYYQKVHESMNGRCIGFGDAELTWLRRLYGPSDQSLYGYVTGVIPTGNEKPSLRYGQWGIEAGGLWCADFCKGNGSYQIQLGYRSYSGFPSDQVRASLGALYWAASRLCLQSSLNLEYGVFNGKRKENLNIILFNPNYRLLKFQAGVQVCLTSWFSGEIGFFKHVWGENVGTGGGCFAEVCLTF
jgi:hypothetical protein